MGGTVEVGAGDCFVVEGVKGTGLGGEEPRASASRRGRRRYGVTAQPGEAGARTAHKRQLRGAALARLPRRGLAPPVAVKRDIPRVVPVDLVVEVHVGDGQAPFTAIIIAKIGGGERRKLRGLRGLRRLGIGASGNELVRRVILVGGNQQSAAEAGAGFADGAAERVVVRTAPTRRIEARRAFVGLGPVRAVCVGRLDDAVEQRFLGATVGIGDDRVRHGAVRAERADCRACFKAEGWVCRIEISGDNAISSCRSRPTAKRVEGIGCCFG